jgi:dimethylglycine dehydrogenase
VSTVEAGIYTTKDGDVCPTLLTTCLAKLAQADGASIVHNAEVDTVTRQPNGTFTVSTVNGALYQADAVVNAAGLWSRKFSRQLGLEDTHPAFVIEHQYAITETIPALKGKVWNDGRGVPCTARSRGRSRGRAPPWPSSSRPLILHLPSNPPLDRRCATASACHACAT